MITIKELKYLQIMQSKYRLDKEMLVQFAYFW